jgi:hypothetical protein
MFQCHSPAHPDSDEVSTSGSELEWLFIEVIMNQWNVLWMPLNYIE